MTQESRIFNAKPMTQWLEQAQDLPRIEPLISPWWNKEETCFFFGGTGIGKTICAMQMAHTISQNEKVLYFDFEMSERQLLQRYENNGELVPFSENLIRVEMVRDVTVKSDEIVADIEAIIKQQEAKVIIIDNLTWLLEDTQDAKTAIPFMKSIFRIKKEHNVSILIMAHTPKRKSMSQFYKGGQISTFDNPLELADMAGSAALNNFIDSCFAIGKSHKDASLRYFKQLKSRSSEIVHGVDNVLVCRLGKTDKGFLGFVKEGESEEYAHILKSNKKLLQKEEVKTMHEEGMSSRKIGEKLKLSHTHVLRIIKGFTGQNGGTSSSAKV